MDEQADRRSPLDLQAPLIQVAFAFLLLILGQTSTAAGEVWYCTYPLRPTAAELNVASKFEVRGASLYESNSQPRDFDLRARYTVLQDSPDTIIAAVSNVELDPDPATASVGAVVIMIDKRSGDLQFTNAIFGQASQQRGHCVHQNE